MQTKFAMVTMRNPEVAITARIVVAWLAGKWVAVRVHDDRVIGLTARAGCSDERLRHYASDDRRVGYYYNKSGDAKAELTEIIAVMRKGLYLTGRAFSFDDPADWVVVGDPEFFAFADARRDVLASTYSAVTSLVRRLWAGAGSVHAARVEALFATININRFGSRTLTADFRGRLNISALGFMGYRSRYKEIGKLLRDVVVAYRRGLSATWDEAMSAFIARVHEASLDGLLNESQSQRLVDLALQRADVPLTYNACGHLSHMGDRARVMSGGSRVFWCTHCVNCESVVVADLSERWARGDAYYSESRDEWYSYDIDDDDGDGDGDGGAVRGVQLMSYTTNVLRTLRPDPAIKSSHYGDFHMGIELEMTSGGAPRGAAVADVVTRLGKDYCIAKRDGSLDEENGFEIVTAPRGLAEHIRRFTEWEVNPAYRAWDAGNCGLHVHVSSLAFTELSLGKYLMFINADTNADFIRKIAGRHPRKDEQAGRYCAAEGQELLYNPKWAVKGKSYERYRMVNTQNLGTAEAKRLGIPARGLTGRYNTVELRIFRASLRKERLLAQIEFAHAVVMFCRVASYRELTGPAFIKWLASSCSLYPHLANWYGIRKSKAIKDAGGKPLCDVCADKVTGTVAVPARKPRLISRVAAEQAVRVVAAQRSLRTHPF